MIRAGRGVVLMCVIALAGACSSLKVTHDYDMTYDFTKLKTYDWAATQKGNEKEELTMRRIERSIDGNLQAKGYVRSSEAPDLLVSVVGVRRTVTGGSVSVGTGVAVPVGNRASLALGIGKSVPRTSEEGTLVISFTEASSGTLVWQGTASGATKQGASPEEQQKRIDSVIAELLKKFPPGKT